MWMSGLDINYWRMDVDVVREQGTRSFPASDGNQATMALSVALTIGWLACFLLTGMHEFTDRRAFRYTLRVPAVLLMALFTLLVLTRGAPAATESD